MDKERYSRSHRDDRDRDSSPDHSPQREGGRRRDRDVDSKRRDSDHYRSSRRGDREDERDRTKDRRGRSVERGEREGSRDREKHHHERSHEGSKEKESRSKRKDREEENGARDGKKKSRFADGNGERRSRFEDVAIEVENKDAQVSEGSGATNPTSGVTMGASTYSSIPSEASAAPSQTLLTKMEDHCPQLGKVVQTCLLIHQR